MCIRDRAYAAKYASGFYGPFREAVESTLTGDRTTYQQDPAKLTESLREVALDVAEGADLVMVKPALPYLDVLRAVAEVSPVPVSAYQVSGEYAQIEAAAAPVAYTHLDGYKRQTAENQVKSGDILLSVSQRLNKRWTIIYLK